MEQHLTKDIDDADFIVDLSVVLKDRQLGGSAEADPQRLQRAIHALAHRENDKGIKLYAVADDSLIVGALYESQASFRRVLSWRDRGLIEAFPDADPRLLELAELTGLPIVSGDLYRGWRDSFPWLQGSTGRVVKIARSPQGRWEARDQHLEAISPAEISKHQERDLLKQQGLLSRPNRRPRLDVVQRLWRCSVPTCRRHDGRGQYIMVPIMSNGKVICAEHGVPLTVAGDRPVQTQIKLIVDGDCKHRVNIRDGQEIPVGRAPGANGLDLTRLLGERGEDPKLSRVHVTLRLRGERLLVRDASTNGSSVRDPATGTVPLSSEWEHALRVGQHVILADGIELTRSGRHFWSELASGLHVEGTEPDAAPPTRRAEP